MTYVYKQWKCNLRVNKYTNNGRMALSLVDVEDGCLITYITSNVPEVDLEHDEIIVKNYSENWGMDVWLIANGITKRTGQMVESGYVEMPIMKLCLTIS